MTRKEVDEIKEHFDAVTAGLRTELTQHVEQQVGGLRTDLTQHVEQQVGGLRTELTQHVEQQVGGLRTELGAEIGGVRQELGAESAETRRYLGVVFEDFRSEIRLVADGVALANERINQVDLRVDGLTGEMRRGFAGVRAEIRGLHETDDELRRRIEAQEQRGA